MEVKKVVTYTITLAETELKDIQSVLSEKANNGSITPSQAELLNSINQNL